MIDIKLIRQNPEMVKDNLQKRGVDAALVDKVLKSDEKRRQLLKETEEIRAEINKKSKTMPGPALIDELKDLKEKLKTGGGKLELAEKKFREAMYQLPNLLLPDVPFGKDERDNVVLYEVGEKPRFGFSPKSHFEIGESLDLVDTRRAAKVSGSRFGYLKGQGALLEFALANFVLDRLTDKGWIKKILKQTELDIPVKEFTPVIPPALINEEMMEGMGYIDTKADKEERYFLGKDKLFLVGTAEQSLGPMLADEILKEDDLPIRYLGFSSCFRREAGSYGKDVRGIMRVHQFDKLEMFSYAHPDDSVSEHKFLIAVQEELVKELGLAYRVVKLASGDLSRPSASTFDIETWFPGLGQYKETHSGSNTTDFQARRLNIRYKDKKNEFGFVHMLNATAFAVGRTVLAILENYQESGGSIKIPKVLRKYARF